MKPLPLAVVAVVSLAASTAVAQVGPDLLLKPLPEDDRWFELTSSATIQETGQSGNGFRLGIDRYENFGRFQLDIPGPVGSVLERAQGRFGYNYTHLHLDTNDPVLPNDLVDAGLGFGMGIFQSQDETIVAGITVGLGYAGSNAFGDANAWYGEANLAVGKEFRDEGRWFKSGDRFGFVINYDGNRSFLPDVPLPGFQFIRKPTEELELSVGFPFSSIVYSPTEQLEFRLQYTIPDSITGRIDYGFDEGFGIFIDYTASTEAFHVNELANGNDRLIFSQQRAEIGLRYRVEDNLNVIAAGGFAFDQDFSVGFDTRDDDDVANASDEPYFRVAVELEL
jgi:hypothetical protein